MYATPGVIEYVPVGFHGIGLVQLEVLNAQPAVHESDPPVKPPGIVVHEEPPRFVPSHCSPESIVPLPQRVQLVVSQPQLALQRRVPPGAKPMPIELQVLPPSMVPSHTSPESTAPLPQRLQLDVS